MKKLILIAGALAALTSAASARTTTVTCNFPRYGVVKLEMQIGPRVRNAETYLESHANSRFFLTVNGKREGAMKTPEAFVSGDYVMSPGDRRNEWTIGTLYGGRPARAMCQAI